MMVLHDYVLSTDCYAVRLLAALLGTPLTLVPVDVHPGEEQKSLAFRRLNPMGRVPVLIDASADSLDGAPMPYETDAPLVLTEPPAMLRHLARHTPDWLAAEPQLSEWLARSIHLSQSLGAARTMAMLCQPGDLAAAQAEGIQWLRLLESALREARWHEHTFLLANAPTIADIALFPHVALAPDGGVSLDDYPSIRLWLRAIRSLPGFIEMPGIHRLHDQLPEPLPVTGGAPV